MISKRKLDDWIQSYLLFNKETEHPTSYHVWNAIATIGGVLQRRVYMPWGRGRIYPNNFIVLVGPSGLGKGESMKAIVEMFSETELKIAPDAVTVEALAAILENCKADYIDLDGRQVSHSSIQVFAGELAVLLGVKDVKKLSWLTDWYDCKDKWEKETKGSGSDYIKGLCVNILGATAPDWFSSIIPEEALGGGFTSRIIFVVEKDKSKLLPYPVYTKEQEKLFNDLTYDLKCMALTFGPYNFDKETKEAYIEYYMDQEKNMKQNIFPVNDPMFRGYCNRRSLHLRKVAMILAVSRNSKRIVNIDDFQKALGVLKSAEAKMPRLFGGVGKSIHGQTINAVMDFLQRYGNSNRSTVLRAFYKDLDEQTILVVEKTLETMGFMSIKLSFDGNNAQYTLNDNFDKEEG